MRSITQALANIPPSYAGKLRSTCDHTRSKVPERWDTLDPVGTHVDEIERVEMRNCPTCGSTLAIAIAVAFALVLGACGGIVEEPPNSEASDAGCFLVEYEYTARVDWTPVDKCWYVGEDAGAYRYTCCFFGPFGLPNAGPIDAGKDALPLFVVDPDGAIRYPLM